MILFFLLYNIFRMHLDEIGIDEILGIDKIFEIDAILGFGLYPEMKLYILNWPHLDMTTHRRRGLITIKYDGMKTWRLPIYTTKRKIN